MRPRSSSACVLASIGRQTVATGAVCGAFVTLALISFTAALIGRLRPAAPPIDS